MNVRSNYRCILGLGMAYVIACTVNVFLVIFKTGIQSVFVWMESLTGHHWTTHGLIVILAFGLSGLALIKIPLEKYINLKDIQMYILIMTILSLVILSGFYLSAGGVLN